MNETESNVYDLVYPSPVTLKEISSIVVAVQLWRKEICPHIEKERRKLNVKLNLKENDIRLRNVIPNLPSAIYDYLEEYVEIFRVSILRWLNYHRENIFTSCDYGSLKNILIRFHDFSWDWNGTIHYARTAKRMILCDQFDEDEKFKIACLYCFEDDIKRIWPSVSSNMDWSSIDFDHFPQLFYWICFLRNELDKVPNPRNVSIDEAMLYKCKSQSVNDSFVKYFWDRIPFDKQAQIVIERYVTWSLIFCRFILQKLNKHNLEMFLNAKGAVFLGFLLYFGDASELRTALRTWMYIQNRISSSLFISYVDKSFRCECYMGAEFYSYNKRYLFSKIWKSAPQHLKRSAIQNILSNSPYPSSPGHPFQRKQVKFLFVLL
ncbi:uncharacterized protein LOC135842711 [Planococcus citri]|uniref:uncharacterized protein LOC135842711 n=1 Tax=Planococcus citri TaxID=170843 RepID=UPI0031F95543